MKYYLAGFHCNLISWFQKMGIMLHTIFSSKFVQFFKDWIRSKTYFTWVLNNLGAYQFSQFSNFENIFNKHNFICNWGGFFFLDNGASQLESDTLPKALVAFWWAPEIRRFESRSPLSAPPSVTPVQCGGGRGGAQRPHRGKPWRH